MLLHLHLCGLARAYVCGQLHPAERRRFARHLARCPRCRAEVRELAELAAWVEADFRLRPNGLRPNGYGRTPSAPGPGARRRRVRPGFAAVAAPSLAACLLAGLLSAPRPLQYVTPPVAHTLHWTKLHLHVLAADAENRIDWLHQRLVQHAGLSFRFQHLL
ncbi:hypothetical protein GCM10010885_18970 [Alicyclobacillus cellulosilyticus]|uniref:Anti-sigma-W factor RsiW n=1 Tax=Alicyclobacillus cellulosilyticus TaxID=1003997 RepID=A0A917KFH4_9BACL|nr:zf-HC2 domain-containing protein [Alicyclobacillus cellulosilyticus]GGJ09996.1 hypothetical protein GCM10010885_18970 [Alicyclobacillus cellulosilyticus]